MPNIAIIDDNPESSGTLKKTLDHHLKKFGSNLSVIVQYPFADPNKYFDFIAVNDVCLLILDERLNDQATPEGSPVDYKGNQLVGQLRKQLKDFPILMITTYSNEDDVLEKESEFEYLLNRDDITLNKETANLYIPRLIRSAQRFLDSNNKELSEYNELTQRVASGETSPELIQRLEALQVKLELPNSGFDDRKVWLDQYAKHIEELEALKKELYTKIKGE